MLTKKDSMKIRFIIYRIGLCPITYCNTRPVSYYIFSYKYISSDKYLLNSLKPTTYVICRKVGKHKTRSFPLFESRNFLIVVFEEIIQTSLLSNKYVGTWCNRKKLPTLCLRALVWRGGGDLRDRHASQHVMGQKPIWSCIKKFFFLSSGQLDEGIP